MAVQRESWSPVSWKSRLGAHQVVYSDAAAVTDAVERLKRLPPLVTSWEIERLRSQIGDAQAGRRFILQGGDCAEQVSDCRPEVITAKLKILLQMSLVLTHALKRPVVRIGRFAGQYAKPRSSSTETRTVNGVPVTLPSYYGDLVNRSDFTPEARRPNPANMVEGYQHAAATLNFIRSLLDAGFADLHHPEYWDLGFLKNAALPADITREYRRTTENLADSLRFMEAVGERAISEISRVEFFTSHEALNLHYESAQTRTVPRRQGWYNLTTHLPWLGARTNAIDGAHVEYLRGICNPVGIKVGAFENHEACDRLVDVLAALNPDREAGKLIVIARLGASKVRRCLPGLIRSVASAGQPVLWMCDPMHGNTVTTVAGTKTRAMTDILEELRTCCDVLEAHGQHLGGVHVELTGEDVTECLGGPARLTEQDLVRNYASPCDPRLNYEQSLELAFELAHRLTGGSRRCDELTTR